MHGRKPMHFCYIYLTRVSQEYTDSLRLMDMYISRKYILKFTSYFMFEHSIQTDMKDNAHVPNNHCKSIWCRSFTLSAPLPHWLSDNGRKYEVSFYVKFICKRRHSPCCPFSQHHTFKSEEQQAGTHSSMMQSGGNVPITIRIDQNIILIDMTPFWIICHLQGREGERGDIRLCCGLERAFRHYGGSVWQLFWCDGRVKR